MRAPKEKKKPKSEKEKTNKQPSAYKLAQQGSKSTSMPIKKP